MKIIVFQHAEIEHPGAFRSYMEADGAEVTTFPVYQCAPPPDLDPFDMMIVMGGVQDVWEEEEFPWLREEKKAIRRFVLDLQRPYLGICLGHQLLVASTGGRVEPAVSGELGLMSVSQTARGCLDPLFVDVPLVIDAVQWHGAEATALPAGAQVLASSQACRVQAVRVGRHGYGIQWHIEADGETVAGWSSQPDYLAHLEEKLPGGAASLEKAVTARSTQLETISRTTYRNLKSLR